MANPKGNEASLVKYKPKWRSGKTQTIRVPIAIVDLVLEAAREIDRNGNQSLLQVNKASSDKFNLQDRLLDSNTDTSVPDFDLKAVEKILESMFAAPSNKGGQIKVLAAELGSLLGFKIEKQKQKWIITDTGV